MGRAKIWITGANGKLGNTIAKMLDYNEYVIYTSDQDVDISDLDEVLSYIDVSRPEIVINCAGFSDRKFCEENQAMAYRVNALGPRNLAAAARKIGAKIIHISSDDVFGGGNQNELTEFDFPNPTTVYGKSKLAGETFVRELNPRHLIIRSSWVYGGPEGTRDFVQDLLEQAKTKKTIQVPNNQISSPTSAKALAKFVVELLHTNEYGVYHASCEGSCTRYEFAKAILKEAGLSDIQVEPSTSGESEVKSTRLRNLMMEITNVYKMPDWREALTEYMTQYKRHKIEVEKRTDEE
jgi:dTDP-4-dehydrorhamnose reductase